MESPPDAYESFPSLVSVLFKFQRIPTKARAFLFIQTGRRRGIRLSHQPNQQPRRRRSFEALLRLPGIGGFQLGKLLRRATVEDGDWNPVAIDDSVADERRQARPGRQDPDEVQGVGAR